MQWKRHKMRWISLLLRQKPKRRNRLTGPGGCASVSLEIRMLPSIGAIPVQSSSGQEGIAPGQNGSFPGQLLNVKGTLYFTATDAVNGQELWRISSSGVAAFVEDSLSGGGIRPGITSSAPSALTNVNGELFFTADDGVNGRELWHVNQQGIAEMIEDGVPDGGIASGAASSSPAYLTDVNGVLYFRTENGRSEFGASVFGLWRVNRQGTAERVGVFSGDHLGSLTNLDGVLYFIASDGVNGRELWKVNRLGVPEMIEDSVTGGGIAPELLPNVVSSQELVRRRFRYELQGFCCLSSSVRSRCVH